MSDAKYKTGDKVKIIDRWIGDIGQSYNGHMDKYLGKTVTIKHCHQSISAFGRCYSIYEDDGRWVWYESMLEDLDNKNVIYVEGEGFKFEE